jgi:hypothetical protein
MKRFAMLLFALAIALPSAALAGARVVMKDADHARRDALIKKLNDHPLTRVVPNENVKVQITTDTLVRSCCMPTQLVVAGTVTNLSSQPIDYVKLIFTFEGKDGRVLHTESLYNEKAASLNDDDQMQRALNEKPHFTALAPGATDRFSFGIPTELLPACSKIELVSVEQPTVASR